MFRNYFAHISKPESTQSCVYHSLAFQRAQCNLEHSEISKLLNYNKKKEKHNFFHEYINIVLLIMYFELILEILCEHNFGLVLCTAAPYPFKLYCGMQ